MFEELVRKYLVRNFTIEPDRRTILIKDTITNELMSADETKRQFQIIFLNLSNITHQQKSVISDIVDEWFFKTKESFFKLFYSKLNVMDYTKTSMELMDEVTEAILESGAELEVNTTNIFYDEFDVYYFDRFKTNGSLDKIKNRIDPKFHTSSNLISLIELNSNGQTNGVTKLIEEYLKTWYYTFFDEKLKIFLDRSTIKLGTTNWYIDNLDYGKIDVNNFRRYFPNETAEAYQKIDKQFNEWYSNEVINASEKEMKIY